MHDYLDNLSSNINKVASTKKGKRKRKRGNWAKNVFKG